MVNPDEAVELSRSAGLLLDDWQEEILRASLETEGERWRHFEVGLVTPRQNGKNAVIEARELAALFLDHECDLIIHSAHEFATSLEASRRLLYLIESTPELDRQIKRVSRSHGDEGIDLADGTRIRFKTRTTGGGRGFGSGLLVLDEAMVLKQAGLAALMPTLRAQPNPQLWYTGSAVDQLVHEHGVVLSRIRERGLAGAKDLLYREFSVSESLDELLENPELMDDRELWAKANPALGIRIQPEHVVKERASLDDRTFAVELLGAGDWPITDPKATSLIPPKLWRSLVDEDSKRDGPITLAYDITPDRSKAAIGIAGMRFDDLLHVEIVEHRTGTGWVVARIAQLVEKHDIKIVRCDALSPAASLQPALASKGVVVQTLSTSEYVAACGEFFDACHQDRLRHLGTPELAAAVNGAAVRNLGEAWAWGRRKSSVDISPLVACTIAGWASAPAPLRAPIFVL